MQIHKRWSDIALQRVHPKMTHLCICFVKKVFSLPQYPDAYYKVTIFVCVLVFYL
jgi:hypothetical protein